MKEHTAISASGSGVPASGSETSEVPNNSAERPNDSASEYNNSASGFGGFAFDDFMLPAPGFDIDDSQLLATGHKSLWALVKAVREQRDQLYYLNQILLGIAKQVWGVKPDLIQPVQMEKPRRRAAAKAANKPKAAKAAKAPKTKKSKEGKGNEQ